MPADPRTHRCDVGDLTYGTASVKCEVCGRRWYLRRDRQGKALGYAVDPVPMFLRRRGAVR